MVKSDLMLIRYPIQGYKTIFNQKSGILIRTNDKNGANPFWCSDGPELLDISINNWCDKGCSFCYKKSDPSGINLSLEDYRSILQQAARMHVLQIALGGGNPNQHPDFCEILRLTREKYNIVPSYTTNGRGLSENILAASKEYCGAVAVSAYDPFEDTFEAVRKLIDHKIRTNIQFLLTCESIKTAIEWLENPPQILNEINAIIFLSYKPIGRNPNKDLLLKNAGNISTFFDLANKSYPFKIGFDSCSISGIARFMRVSPIFVERCEAGRFSLYVSEDMKIYPCSFMVNIVDGIPVTKSNIVDVWRNHDYFTNIRELLKNKTCQIFSCYEMCSGGCPIFPEINICP